MVVGWFVEWVERVVERIERGVERVEKMASPLLQ